MGARGHRLRWVIVGVAVVAVLAVVGPFFYIHVIEGPAPAKLTLPKSATAPVTTAVPAGAAGAASTLDGTWNVSAGSVVGYRVQEVLIGQQSTAVGRTERVSGRVTVAGSSVQHATVVVDMASVKSDQSERNAQFDGRIMDVGTYPTATLVLTSPLDLGHLASGGPVEHFTADADLTMHGVTKPVTVTLSVRQNGGTVYVLAEASIVFADWDIANPSVGGFVTTQQSGTLEALLYLTRGSGNAPVTASSSAATQNPGGATPVTVPSTTVPPLKVPSP